MGFLINLSIDNNGKLVIVDNTQYSNWESNVSNHIALDVVLDSNLETVFSSIGESISKVSLPYDGLFIYRKLLIPTTGECHVSDGEIFLNGSKSTFDEVFDIVGTLPNVFSFEEKVFSIHKLEECFVATEKDALTSFIKTGCDGTCGNGVSFNNSSLLCGALLVLKHFISENNFVEAQRLINRLQTCSGICGNMRLDNNGGCGCG